MNRDLSEDADHYVTNDLMLAASFGIWDFVDRAYEVPPPEIGVMLAKRVTSHKQ